MGSSKTIVDLPSDLLLPILSRLDLKDLQSLSLVSKPFLELSNRFVRKLTFKTLPDDRSFTQIFTRFSSVNQITLNTKRIAGALTAISKSQLNLETLKIGNWPTYPEQISLSGKLNIKSLAFCFFSKFQADQVVEFIGLFPSLEELHFGTTRELDDADIESLALKVPNLRKIDLSGFLRFYSQRLLHLSAPMSEAEISGLEMLP
ncbi:unnamed protein product [Rhodiola kirilowii]